MSKILTKEKIERWIEKKARRYQIEFGVKQRTLLDPVGPMPEELAYLRCGDKLTPLVLDLLETLNKYKFTMGDEVTRDGTSQFSPAAQALYRAEAFFEVKDE